MWQDVKAVYRETWRAALLLPIAFLIPALVEFAQHVVEMNAGMYQGGAAAKLAANDPMRMIFGYAKTVAITIPGYWFVRWLAFRDHAKAIRIELPAIGLWLVLFAMNAITFAMNIFGPPLGTLLGLAGPLGESAGPILNGLWSLLGIYLTAWAVAWPLGNRTIGPLCSVQVMAGSFWRTVAYLLLCTLPLMGAHYALGYLAILAAPDWLDWPILVLDSLVVAGLACTMVGASYIAARRATQRKSISLLPG